MAIGQEATFEQTGGIRMALDQGSDDRVDYPRATMIDEEGGTR